LILDYRNQLVQDSLVTAQGKLYAKNVYSDRLHNTSGNSRRQGDDSDNILRQRGSLEDMRKKQRSECPVNLTLEMLGDRWSLIVIRDVMFRNRRHYNDLLRLSEEGISSNILADRLNRLMRLGLLTRTADPTHKQKAIYSLTEASIQLVPLMACIIAWGKKHTAAAKVKRHGQRSIRGQILEEGGQRMWEPFMAELRAAHLGAPAPRRSIFIERLAALERAAKPGNKTSK